ncbi:MAG: DUF4172 domain-containing protein [Pseudomonadota bacterium]
MASDWPNWRYDLAGLAAPLAEVTRAQGLLLGRLADVGMALRDQASLAVLTEDVVKTSEIEGEQLNVESVRSSIARRLGVDIGALAPADRHVEGVVEMVLDATGNCDAPISRERLFDWHAALFPTGYSGIHRIRVGGWRNDAGGPMQVVSGPVGRRRVHFDAPPAARLETETRRFFDWVNGESGEPPLIKAGLAHLWFVTLHPFDDGNGRIARAIGDLLLARADGSPQRFYSLSAQIQRERKADVTLEAMRDGQTFALDRPQQRIQAIVPDGISGFQRFVELRSVTELSRELAADGITTKPTRLRACGTRNGTPMDKKYLSKMLRNPIYVGEIQHKGTSYAGQHEPIISRQLWDRVQEILAEDAHARMGRRRRVARPMRCCAGCSTT